MMSDSTWLLVCNPENRRHDYFQHALQSAQGHRAFVLPYSDLLNASRFTEYLQSFLANIHCQHLRIKIESPGENAHVTNGLIAKATGGLGKNISTDDETAFSNLHLKYRGFICLLKELEKTIQFWSKANDVRVEYINTPDAIALMCDKLACQQLLQQNHVSVAKRFELSESFSGFLDYLAEERLHGVFIKPRYGSSAAGVIALRYNARLAQVIARTSLELIKVKGEYRAHNNLKIREYRDFESVDALYQLVYSQGGYAEQWIPKPQHQGFNFDFRIVAIQGSAKHVVMRCSKGPMTNLHLANQRGNIDKLENSQRILDSACHIVENSAAVFSDAGCFGADVIVSPNTMSSYILELNAFGDLLPGIQYQGRDTYATQIKCWT